MDDIARDMQGNMIDVKIFKVAGDQNKRAKEREGERGAIKHDLKRVKIGGEIFPEQPDCEKREHGAEHPGHGSEGLVLDHDLSETLNLGKGKGLKLMLIHIELRREFT